MRNSVWRYDSSPPVQTATFKLAYRFDLNATVGAHGWVMLDPWRWDGLRLTRQQRLGDSEGTLTVVQLCASDIVAEWTGALVPKREIEFCVRRWLSLDWEPTVFREIAGVLNPDLASFVDSGGGRFLRGSCFYEDFVKTVCTINTTWAQTIRMVSGLGRVDKPDPIPDRGDLHEPKKAQGELIEPCSDAPRVLDPVEVALDPVSQAIDRMLDRDLDLAVRLGRDHRHSSVGTFIVTNVVAIITPVSEARERPLRDGVGQLGCNLRVVRLARRDQQAERIAVGIRVGMNFGREATTRTAQTLAMSPPFAPAAQ